MSRIDEWNSRYQSLETAYGYNPNEFLVSVLKDKKPGSILFPGEGEGRNSLWAAKMGWKVSAFDFSSEAMAKAQKLYKQNGVSVSYSVAEALNFNPVEQFDSIALIYVHLPSSEREEFYKKCISWLKPNGFIVMECFHIDQIERTTGGPKNSDLFQSIEEFKETFSNFKIEILRKEDIRLNEGPLHIGNAVVIRFVGKKLIAS